LLPRWRGASPISAAIAAGDTVTGVTIMKMDVGLDSGPMIAHVSEPIQPDDSTGTLTPRLAQLGADLLVRTLPGYLSGALKPEAQDETRVTTCRMIKKEEGRIDWSRSAVEIERHIRAMTPWPGAFAQLDGKQLKMLRASAGNQLDRMLRAPGSVFMQGKDVLVACGGGALALHEVQLEGKKALPAGDFARGQRGFVGTVLGM
jgi:methionyl-tRNA formyltransferase